MTEKARTYRRVARFGVVAVAVTAVVAGCAATPSGPEEEEQVTIRFNWWGSDSRHALTQEVIDLFEAEHPNITVVPEFAAYTDYWSKLSTSAAARDLPDVFTTTDPFIYEYIDNGLLMDVSDYSEQLPTTAFTEGALLGATVGGALYGVPAGLSAFAYAADPVLFEEAGIELPDDTQWTWEEYAQIGAQLSAALPGVYGATLPLDEQAFNMWVRQQGEDLWSPDDAQLAFTVDTAEEWWNLVLEMRDSGAVPSAELQVEQASLGLEQSLIATQGAATQVISANQLGALDTASGRDLQLMLFPGESDGDRPGSYSKPGMYYAISAGSEHPEESAMLIDFIVNTVEAGEILRVDRGVPANPDVLAEIEASLSPSEQKIAEYNTRVDEISDAGFPKPNLVAGPELVSLYARLNQEVLFDRMTPRQAAEQLVNDLEAIQE